MRYRIRPDDTLSPVPSGERRYDDDCADHARDVLRTWVQARGGQSAAAKLLGVNQSTINRALDPASQPTLKVLIPLAIHLRWSLDQLLGLKPPPAPPAVVRVSDSEVQRIAEKVATQVARRLTPKAMPAVRMPPKLPPPPKLPSKTDEADVPEPDDSPETERSGKPKRRH